jgi:predicted dehydrogenase
MSDLSRRDLLKAAALATAGVATSGRFTNAIAENVSAITHPDLAPPAPAARKSMRAAPFEKHDVVRIGMVGTGLRGRSLLRDMLGVPNVKIVALCDLVPEKAQMAAKLATDAGQAAPALHTGSDHAFEKLVARDDLDLVYTATPWEWHTPVALAALAHGKHAAAECPIGTTLKDLWAIVDASERAGKHCMQLENCNYGYNEMMVNRMVHDGLFGEVLHAEAAYLHDLRKILFETKDEGLWRRAWHTRSNSNLYPTHGLGPVSWYLDVHAGDRFDYIVAVATPERGLSIYREETVAKSDPRWRERYITGDLNTSIIKTVNGKTVMMQHDVSNPRPYSRHNRVMGTKGTFEDYPPRIYVEGQEGGEKFQPIADDLKKKFEHPLWTQLGAKAQSGGHGGMDYVMAWRLIQCMREGLAPDYDVYDAAAWSAPLPLTEISVAKGSMPIRFPDFTRGDWKKPRA